MAKFRTMPVVVEAVEWNGSMQDIINFIGHDLPTYGAPYDGALRVSTPSGDQACLPGYWIVRASGELSVCKPDIFFATHEAL